MLLVENCHRGYRGQSDLHEEAGVGDRLVQRCGRNDWFATTAGGNVAYRTRYASRGSSSMRVFFCNRRLHEKFSYCPIIRRH